MGWRGGSSGEREKSGGYWKFSFINVVIIAFVLTILSGNVQCCGPGRGGGRRRSPRKLTPLVFKQHVPNLSENTLGASGISEGAIDRDDPKFHDLVPNYNSDIIFKDEEGTGADRLMTEGCKEKLNTLAISVMNQWPGLKLRVTEGWDEEQHHAGNSLHYEGRAVDITTSDKDRAKYGMLARLAVEAGFDWVYYESRSHIHCSVKSERSAARKLGGCFPSSSTVETPGGAVEVSDLQEGDLVQVMKPNGSLDFSPILMFLHKDADIHRRFLKIGLSSGSIITLTPSHLLWVLRQKGVHLYIPEVSDALSLGVIELAGRVELGDYLLVTNATSGKVNLEKVVNVEAVTGEGVFAPLTDEGTIVVDGVVASCYAVIDSQAIAHWAFLPVRVYYNLKEIALDLFRGIGVISSPRTESSEKYGNSNENSLSKNILETNKNSVTKESDLPKESTVKNIVESNILHPKHKLDRHAHLDEDSKHSNPSNHIHWYPRLLYTVATWLLPSHLVYS